MCFVGIYSQTNYKITYKIAEPKMQGSQKNLDDNGREFFTKVFRKAKTIRYQLITNGQESYFEEVKALNTGNESPLDEIAHKMAKRFASFNEKVYSNTKTDTMVFLKSLVNQEYLVKRKFYDFNWDITNEKKDILGFECIRAAGTYYNPVTRKKSNISAWFIPSIPLKMGPDIFTGLPGLIAEIDTKGAIVTLHSIVKDNNFDFIKLDTTKAMNQKEYEDLISQLTEKFIEN